MMFVFSIRCFLIFLYSTAKADLIFVADDINAKIYASSLSASGSTSLSSVDVNETLSEPFAIDYDPEHDCIFWTDISLRSIHRARYDGTDHVTLITDIDARGLAIDLASGRVFWTDFYRHRIEVAYLNGTGRSSVISDGIYSPRAIVTDRLHGLLFWTEAKTNAKIVRANMDGSNPLTVIGTSLYFPNGIAIDPVGNKLYWCDDNYDKLETSDLFGDSREILLQGSSVRYPIGVAVHAEYLYWTDHNSRTLKRINRYESGGSIEEVVSNIFAGPTGLHVYEVDECSSSPCQNNGVCVDIINSFQCSCPEGFTGTLCEKEYVSPNLICPGNIDEATKSCQATVTWNDPVVTDNIDNGMSATCTPSSGSSFNAGSTDVTCSAVDAAGNEQSCMFVVNIIGNYNASPVPGYLITIVIIVCVINLAMSPAFIFFCRFYFSQKNNRIVHATGMNMTDYDDVEVPTITTNTPDDTGYEMSVIGDNDAAASPKLESESVNSAYEDPNMSVEPAYTNLQN